jgi:hypothetical protein
MSNAVESNSNSSTTMPGRIVVQQRALGTPQHVRDAALFVIRFPATSVATTSRIRSELQAHVGVLGANLRARLLLVLPSVLCGHEGMVNAEVEAMARMRDLTSWQLANEGETEMSPLLDLVRGIHDGAGRIVVVSKFAARHHPAVALEMRYQSYAEVELQSPRSKQAGYLLDDL